jgi:GTP-binding protein
MRREGFELMVGPPTVIEKFVDGVRSEPYEMLEITVPNDYSGAVVDILNKRKGQMTSMGPAEGSEGQTQLNFLLPTRGMIGIRSSLMTATKGTIVMDTQFDSYKPYAGQLEQREKGSLLAFESGTANPFGISGAQERGRMFITPKTDVYKDMIIGVHQRPGDLAVNVCKTKQLTNMRAAGSDDMVQVVPPLELNLDIAVEYIAEDELVEVTPTKIRMLKHPDHEKMAKKNKPKA